MPELREDPITGRWVIIATERSKRPSDFPVREEVRKSGNCPFCQGNEALTPPEIMSYRREGTAADEPGWWIRVVPNKFPALERGELKEKPQQDGPYTRLKGIGAHEVIIESAEHDVSLENQSTRQIEDIFRAWRDRLYFLRNLDDVKYVQIFKNEGAVAGASLQHPHSQIIAVPVIPDVVREELRGAEAYYNSEGECLYCRINVLEQEKRVRLVAENDSFVAFCPFASRFPFETWISPRKHQADFSAMDDHLLGKMGLIIRDTLKTLTSSLKNPPYNMVLHTAPTGYEDSAYYHWHLEILPRLTTVAGFEWGTGIYINPTPPEEAARYLREAYALSYQ